MSENVVLSARGLVKRYAGDGAAPAVLDGLDLDIRRGEIVAVIGRSGSGKSTLLNVVGQMDKPDRGRIEVLGVDTAHWRDAEQTRFRRQRLGFVFQAYNLLPTLTVRENIALPLELNGLACEPRAGELLAALGLTAVAERYPDQVSGGEQQRTAIARAVSHRPALVTADKPTGNLDADTGAEVVRLFERAVRDSATALLMATHSREMVGHADRVLALDHGRLQTVDA
ncbi:MAG: ABC transporter ATP-binding protein [Gammaproteobacteria bacterium]|nr:ABC transporter ATP-binding protein [Gammaproteobacteria bacterium]